MVSKTKLILCYSLGPISWLCSSILFLMIAVYIWEISAESVLALSFAMYIASAMSGVIGFHFAKDINYEVSQRIFFIILTSFIVFWLIFGVIESFDTEKFTYRISSFIAALIGVIFAYIYLSKE